MCCLPPTGRKPLRSTRATGTTSLPVVLDMMMPFMDGSSAIRALRKINPTSGSLSQADTRSDERLGGAQRPDGRGIPLETVHAEKLLKTLTQVLESSPRP